VLENGKVILARRIEIIPLLLPFMCEKKKIQIHQKYSHFFIHFLCMHLYKNVNPLQSGIGEEGQSPYGMRVV
jgi:hypothetical protein